MTAFTHSNGGHVFVIYNSDTPEVTTLCENKYVALDEGKVADVGAKTAAGPQQMDKWAKTVGTNVEIIGQKLSRTNTPVDFTYLGFGEEEVRSGKRTWKLKVTQNPPLANPLSSMFVGVASPSDAISVKDDITDLPDGRFLNLYEGSLVGGGKFYADPQGTNVVKVGDEIELRLDADTGSLIFYRNGTQFGPGFATGEVEAINGLVLAVGLAVVGQAVTIVE